MNPKKPRILLIGAGAFGLKHLETLRYLERQGILALAGVVVRTKRSQRRLRKERAFPVYDRIPSGLLDKIDAVVIATPPETHLELALQCLPKVNVFIEKPLASDVKGASIIKKYAAASPHILMVGHIFRFHPVVVELKKILKAARESWHSIECSFVNTADTDNGRDV